MTISSGRPLTVAHLYRLERLVAEQEARAGTAWAMTLPSPITLGSTPATVAIPRPRDGRHVVRFVFSTSGDAAGEVTLRAGSWTGIYQVSAPNAGVYAANVPAAPAWNPVTATYSGTGTVRLWHVAIAPELELRYPTGQFVPADAGIWNGLAARVADARGTPRVVAGWLGSQAVTVGKSKTPLLHAGKFASSRRWSVTARGTRTTGSDVTTWIGATSYRVSDASGTQYHAVLTVDATGVLVEAQAASEANVVTVEAAQATVREASVSPQVYVPGSTVSASALDATYQAAAALLEVPAIALSPVAGAVAALGSTPIDICYGMAPPAVPDAPRPARVYAVIQNLKGSPSTVTIAAYDSSSSVSASAAIAAGATAGLTGTGTLDAGDVLAVKASATISGNYRIWCVFAYI